jgi:hypothetical protein
MKIESTLKLLVGATVVYAVVAACGSGSNGFMGGHDGGTKSDAVSPVPDAMADIQSGSRLKAQYYAGTDGSKTFASMYDSQLKVPCAFVTASDGSSRCFPTGLGAAAGTAYYSDSHCSQPILNVPSVCTAPPAYVTTAGTSCNGTTTFHVFPAGSSFSPGTDVYLGAGSGATGTCTKIPTSATAGSWFSVGTELAPSMFVEGTLQTD